MVDLQVENLPEPVYRELLRRAAPAGMTTSDYDLDLIRRDHLPSHSEWAAEVRVFEPAEMDEKLLRANCPTTSRADAWRVIVDASAPASLERRDMSDGLAHAAMWVLPRDRRLAAAPGLGVPVTLLPA